MALDVAFYNEEGYPWFVVRPRSIALIQGRNGLGSSIPKTQQGRAAVHSLMVDNVDEDSDIHQLTFEGHGKTFS